MLSLHNLEYTLSLDLPASSAIPRFTCARIVCERLDWRKTFFLNAVGLSPREPIVVFGPFEPTLLMITII